MACNGSFLLSILDQLTLCSMTLELVKQIFVLYTTKEWMEGQSHDINICLPTGVKKSKLQYYNFTGPTNPLKFSCSNGLWAMRNTKKRERFDRDD